LCTRTWKPRKNERFPVATEGAVGEAGVADAVVDTTPVVVVAADHIAAAEAGATAEVIAGAAAELGAEAIGDSDEATDAEDVEEVVAAEIEAVVEAANGAVEAPERRPEEFVFSDKRCLNELASCMCCSQQIGWGASTHLLQLRQHCSHRQLTFSSQNVAWELRLLR